MIIYIHGFNSIGNGVKKTQLENMFPSIEIYSPSYDSTNFNTIDDMVIEIANKIQNEKNVLFIGCSLGGYIAQYLAKHFNCKAILLNPCYDIKILHKFLGKNILYHSNKEYYLTTDDVSVLDKYKIERGYTSLRIYVNKDDDVIPYQDVVNYYTDRPITIFENGGHRFDNLISIKEDILNFYNAIF